MATFTGLSWDFELAEEVDEESLELGDSYSASGGTSSRSSDDAENMLSVESVNKEAGYISKEDSNFVTIQIFKLTKFDLTSVIVYRMGEFITN